MQALAKLASGLRGLLPGGTPSRPAPSAAFMRTESPLMLRWTPALRETNDDVRQAWRLAVARTIDMFHNSGFLAGAREQSIGAVLGTGLNLDAKPNAIALGWTEDQAADWAERVEARFSVYINSPRACDARGIASGHQLVAQGYGGWMATGEILATFPYIERAGSPYGTKLRILPAWRLSSESNLLTNTVQGVRLDDVGAPIGYRVKRKTRWGGEEEVDVRAFDPLGRRAVLHVFDGEPDQVRGISPWAPVLKVFRQFDQLADATLTTTLIQTVFAAMFKSAARPEDVLAAMTAESDESQKFVQLLTEKSKWYDKTDVNLGVHGKLLHGFPGDELQFFRNEHPNPNYQPFARFLLLEASRVAAMTLAEFTGDYTGETYSSIQMGTAVNWPRVLWRRHNIAAPVYQAVYEGWLEEDIEQGGTPFPGGVRGFLANRDAAAQAIWRGGPKPSADDLKTAKALETWRAIGVPDSVIFAMLGGDVDEWYALRAREQKRRAALGLTDPAPRKDPTGDALAAEDNNDGAKKKKGEDDAG